MIVKSYNEKHLGCIAEMERKAYPYALQSGTEALQEEFSVGRNRSRLAFRNGELVGYIIAYALESEPDPAPDPDHIVEDPFSISEQKNDNFYISDLNCTDKSALLQLLADFFLDENLSETAKYEAECRPASFKLLSNRRFQKAIRIIRKEKIENYYTIGEHAYKVLFEFDKSKVTDWQPHFMAHISRRNYIVGLSEFFDFIELRFPHTSAEDINRSTNLILRLLNRHNLSLYEMFGDKITITAQLKMAFKTEDAAQKYCRELKKSGYTEADLNIHTVQPETFVIYNDILILYITHQYEYPNANSYHDLSSARHLHRVLFKDIKLDPNKSCTFHDKYGASTEMPGFVPYCNRMTWKYALRNYAEKMRLDKRVFREKIREYSNQWNNPGYFLKELTGVMGFTDAAQILDRIVDLKIALKEDEKNFIHDWNTVISTLLNNKKYLTKGAYIACLSGSYNSAKKYSEAVNAIVNMVNPVTRTHRKTAKTADFIIYVRKHVSGFIRKGQELAPLIKELDSLILKLNAKELSLSKRDEAVAVEFIQRMSQYTTYINTTILIGSLGKSLAKKILLGKMDGLFKPKEYVLGDNFLCEDVIALFNSKTKQAKRVYNDLRMCDCLRPVFQGALSNVERAELLRILKLRNYKISAKAQLAPLFMARIEPKCSPEFLVAGDASVCCMRFGAHNAMEYAVEEGFGILNIYYKERIIANSVLWIEDEQNCLVLDNIEVHPNYIVHSPYISELYRIATTDIMHSYDLDFTVQGLGYTGFFRGSRRRLVPLGRFGTGVFPCMGVNDGVSFNIVCDSDIHID